MSSPVRHAPRIDPMLIDEVGHAALLLGNEAIVRGALEAGVGFASGYPGTPSSEVTDTFARVAPKHGVAFEYSINEKVALEMAFAASLAGTRSICAMKHLGLMFAGDPLSTIPYIGTVGGMVIVSAGDPSLHTSPNEQDQRHLGPMLHLPVLDPSSPSEALLLTRRAFELSEESSLPVLLRVTSRVCHTRAVVRYGRLSPPRAGEFVRDPKRFVPIPHNARRLRGEIDGRLERARRYMAEAGMTRRQGQGRLGIVAAGSPAALCRDLLHEHGLEEQVTLLTLAGVYPLPDDELVALARSVDKLLVVEELTPFIEDALSALCGRLGVRTEILGKRSGHLPTPFEYLPETVARGVQGALGLLSEAAPEVTGQDDIPLRPPVLCPGCPHRDSYFAARAAFPEEQLFFNDIGCYTLGYGEPLNTADALLCMGAGFTLAAGVSRVTGQRTVGFMGDSTFFHSGMPALLDAIKEDANMVAVILDNEVTAMTGFQQSPTAKLGRTLPRRRADIEAVVRALGAGHVEKVDPANFPQAIPAFERARDAEGVSVIICQRPCPVHETRELGTPPDRGTFTIDPERCQSCGRSGCGMRCDQGVSLGQERHMARSRALESPPDTGFDPKPSAVAACTKQCPLGLCIQGYSGHIAAGQYREALALIVSRLPLPDSVCRVCHRPCEVACVRAAVDEPVAVNDLKRFVVDWAAREGVPYDPPRDGEHGRSVAIVGAGPAGLAAAHELRLRGYRVRLCDAADKPGGLLRYGIPRFRLPLDALDRDVDRILSMGVAFEGGVRLGRDVSLEGLLDDHDAVLLAVGAAEAQGLALDGSSPVQVVDALRYLSGEAPATGKQVVVIGGGNAAMDAARTALRRGAERVTVAYRRSLAAMPALREEVAAAIEEGVLLRAQLQPVGLEQQGPEPSAPWALLCAKTGLGGIDSSGRRRPVVIDGSRTLIEADQVILAVGQKLGDEVSTLGLALAHGNLEADPETRQTSHPRVFAAGDACDGPRTVTDAIAHGLRAAWGIDRALRGQELADRRAPPPLVKQWPIGERSVPRRADRGRRARPGELPLTERRTFDEVTAALTEAEAQAEARRCMVCGNCANCRACLDTFGCPAFYVSEGSIRIDPKVCTSCGTCSELCPGGAIRYLPPAGEDAS